MSILSSILLAIALYQYDFLTFSGPLSPPELWGHIEFLEPSGRGGLEAVHDFSFITDAANNHDIFGNLLPEIPAQNLTLNNLTHFAGAFEWSASTLSGDWEMEWRIADSLFYLSAVHFEELWPLQYNFPESGSLGRWEFAGQHQVPEAGSTLLYLALGTIPFIWRKTHGFIHLFKAPSQTAK
jgi:hypothetical protein